MASIRIKDKTFNIPIIPIVIVFITIFALSVFLTDKRSSYKEIVKTLEETINKGGENATSNIGTSPSTHEIAVDYIRYQVPENFYIDSIGSYKSKEFIKYKINYSSRYTLENYATDLERFNSYIDDITSQIDPNYNTYEKIQWISEYMCDNYEYDNGYNNRNALEMLDDKKGVCTSYATLFQAFMNKLDIPCVVVLGTCDSGYGPSYKVGYHAWNLVKVGLWWYHIDITWMDNTEIDYRYFLKSTKYYKNVGHFTFDSLDNKSHLLWFNKDEPKEKLYKK